MFSPEEEKRSKLDRIMASLRGEGPEDDALTLAVRHHIYYGGGQDSFMAKYNRLVGDQPMEESRLFSDLNRLAGEFDLDDESIMQNIKEVTAYSAFSMFDQDVQNNMGDVSLALKRMNSRFYYGAEEGNQKDATFASRNLIDSVYREYSVQRRENNDGGREPSPLDEMKDHVLDTILNSEITSGKRNVLRIESEVNRIVNGNLTRAKRMIGGLDKAGRKGLASATDGMLYVNRPGIYPFLSLIEGANNEIVIDTFQFQNKAVSDYLYSWVKRKADAGENPRLTIRLAMPMDRGNDNRASFEILGPNLVQMLKFEKLKEELGGKAEIKVIAESDRHHGKLYWTDKQAIIGSINLTSPVGHNPLQAGANFESMRIFNSRLGNLSVDDLHLAASNSLYRQMMSEMSGAKFSSEDIREELLYRQVTDLKNRMQAKDPGQPMNFMDRRGQVGMGGDIFEHLEKTVNLMYSYGNTYSTAIGSLISDGASQDEKRSRYRNRAGRLELHMMLDQVMMLQYSEGLFQSTLKGEFGDFEEEELASIRGNSSRIARYRRVQRKVLAAAIEGRAFIFADTRNLRENVLDPLLFGKYDSRTNETSASLISKDLLEAYEYDLRRIALEAEGSTAAQKVSSLTTKFGATYGLKSDMALQILALGSGNIRATAVPRQHAKQYALLARFEGTEDSRFDYDLRAVAGTISTSNFGIGSSPMRFEDGREYSNNQSMSHEIGMTFMLHTARSMTGLTTISEYSLRAEQEYVELQSNFLPFWKSTIRQLGDSHIDNANFMDVNSRSVWENKVDRRGLVDLKSRIEEMIRSTGLNRNAFSINTVYNASSSRAIALEVGLDVRALAGFGIGQMATDTPNNRMSFRFTTLEAGVGTDGKKIDPMVYAVDQGLMLGRSIFVNNSDRDVKVLGRDVASKTQVDLSSIDNTIAFLATLSAEASHRLLLGAPRKAFEKLDVSAQREAIGNYLARMAGIQGGTLEDLYNPSVLTAEHALKLAEAISSRMGKPNKAAINAANLAGIDYQDGRRVEQVESLVRKIQYLAEIGKTQGINEAINKRRTQIIGAGDSIINQMMNQIMSLGYADLLLDVVSYNTEIDYYRQIGRDLEKVKRMLLEPYLTIGQHNIYGSSQGHYRLGVRGVSNAGEYATALDMVNSGNVLASYALASMSLAYGPTSSLRRYGLIRGVADKSTINFGVGEGLSFFDAPSQDVGDVTEMQIISSLGVGSIVKRHELQAYMEGSLAISNERVNSLLDQAFGSKEMSAEMVTFNFDTAKKAAQIPQRLKNALGARPLFDISELAQNMLESDNPKHGNMKGLGLSYVNDLKEQLKNHFIRRASQMRRDGRNTEADSIERSMELMIEKLITPDMDIGIMFAGKIRSILSQEMAATLEAERNELEALMGDGSSAEGIGAEILRVRALRMDMYGQAIRGFIGGSKRHGKPVALVQLAGSYSDYFYANPLFGGSNGMRQGWMEKAEKRVKASMLSTDWQEKIRLKVGEGYTIKIDRMSQKAAVFDENGNFVQLIDDRNQFDVLAGVVENIAVNDHPSLANVQATSANRLGEDSRELIMRVTHARPASVDKYQMLFELSYIRTIKPGGGRRIEGNWAGSLVKGVSNFATENFFQFMIDELNQRPGGVFSGQLDIRNVFGMLNPSNLKSFAYSHGAEILTDGNLRAHLLNLYSDPAYGRRNGSQRLAAALMLGFGTSFINGSDSEISALQDNLFRMAATGVLGDYYQDVAAATGLLYKPDRKGGNGPGSVFTKNASFNVLQTPVLAGITAEDIRSAIDGSGTELLSKIRNSIDEIASDPKSSIGKGYMIMGDTKQMQASIILTALDLFDQMSTQVDKSRGKGLINVPTDIDVTDPYVRQQLASILHLSMEDLENQDKIEGMIAGISSRVPVLRMYMDLSYSQSKEPIGSRMTGKLEMQHLIKPFLDQAVTFSRDRNLDKMRVAVANMFAAISQGSLYQFLDSSLLPHAGNIVDITDPFLRTPMFKKRMLGVHGSGVEPDVFEKERALYIATTNQLEEEIKRSKVGATNRGKIDRLYKKLLDIEYRLAELGRHYQIFDDKPAGVGISNAIVGSMNHKGFGFFVPAISSQVVDGETVVTVDKTKGFYSFLPSGEDLRMMGAQFGNYVDEVIQASINIQSAFAPGSPLEGFFNRMSQLRGRSQMVVTPDEIRHVAKFYESSHNMIYLLSEAVSGTRLQRATGAGIPLRGGVTTPAASFLVAPELVVLAKETLDKNGLRVSASRWNALDHVNAAISSVYHDLAQASPEDKTVRSILNLKKKFLTGQQYALTEGVSEQGTKFILDQAIKESQRLEKIYNRAMQTEDVIEKRKILDRLRHESNKVINTFRNRVDDTRKKGDSFAQLAAVSEIEYWKSKAFIGRYESEYGPLTQGAANALNYHRMKVEAFSELPFHVAKFNLGSNGAIASDMRIHHSAMEGALRGNSTFSPFHSSIIDEIYSMKSSSDKQAFLDYKLSKLIDQTREIIASHSDNRQGPIKESVRSMMRSQAQLGSASGDLSFAEKLMGRLEEIKTRNASGNAMAGDIISDINTAFASYDLRGVSQVMGFRSPPFGSTEPQLQMLSVIRDMAVLNEYAASRESVSGSRYEDRKLIRYDSNRNKTLTLLSPISILTMNLGDFDGDPYTFIFREVQDLVFDTDKKRDRIEAHHIQRRRVLAEINDLTYSGRVSAAMAGIDDPDYLEKMNSYHNLDSRIRNLEKEISQNELKIKIMNEHVQRDMIESGAAARQVAAYMGIDPKFMLSTQQGGYLNEALDANTMFTFIEQGHGLFSGLEAKGKDLNKIWTAFDRLIEPDFTSSGANLNKHLGSIEDFKARASQLAAEERISNSGMSMYENILSNDGLASNIHSELTSFVQAKQAEMINEREYSSRLGEKVSSIYNSMMGMNAMQGFLAKGGGASMEMSTYDMLTKVLGKAGGDILGKTYNSLVGTLFADSPLLALSHVLTRDDSVTRAVESHIDRLIDNGQLERGNFGTGAQFVENVKQASYQSEQLMGFMKSVQQMLRDSIKLKDGTNTIDTLKASASLYDDPNLDDAGRARVLNDIVKDMGPGPGLKALMRLDSFVSHLNDDINGEILAREFGIGEHTREYNFARDLISKNIDPSKSYQINKMVAAYKTTRDLQHMIASYRFDKDSNAGQMFMDQFMQGFLNKRLQEVGSAISGNDRNALLRSSKQEIVSLFRGDNEYSRALDSYLSFNLEADDRTTYSAGAQSDYEIRLNKFVAEKGEDQLVLFHHIYEQTRKETSGIFGGFGENLIRFAQFDSVREAMAGVMSGSTKLGALANISGPLHQVPSAEQMEAMHPDERRRAMNEIASLSSDVMGSDITLTLLNLAASNKLDPSAAAIFYQSMEGIFKLGAIGGDPKDILTSILTSTTRFNNGNENATKVANQFTALAALERGRDDNDFSISFRTKDGQESRASYAGLMDYLQQSMSETRTGMESQMISAFVKSVIDKNKGEGRMIRNSREFVQSVMSGTEVTEEETSHLTELVSRMVPDEPTMTKGIHVKKVLEGEYSGVARETLRKMSDHSGASTVDFIAPLMLSIMGQAIASGSVEPEAMQDMIGSSMVAFAFSRPSFMPSTAGVLGAAYASSFKFRMSLDEANGNPGEAFARLMGRELAFNLVTAVAAPPLTEFMSTKLFGLRPHSMDHDYHEGARNVAGMISGAILSSFLGVMAGNIASNSVAIMNQVGPAGLVDSAIEAIATKARKIKDEEFLRDSEVADLINDEDGSELNPDYSSESTAFYGSDPQSTWEATYAESSDDVSVPVNLFGSP